MYGKIVGDFMEKISFITGVNPKRKQALPESNLPAIRLTQNNGQ
jgi:hypothetical protein